jgi:glycosyltransferase involved in cell wall biosynthesis
MSTTLPTVSVVMPIRNEADFITRSLGAVLSQDYPADRMEVIVADGCSDDGTREIVRAMAARDSRVTVLDNQGRIVATGLNQALAIAKGEIVVRVDGHCEIAPDYVRCCVSHLQRGEAEGVGGPLDTVGQSAIARAIAVAMSSRFGVGNSAFRTVTGRSLIVDTVAFPAYTREVLDRVGPFDTELVRNQDDEYNYRLRKMGGRLLLAADVHSRYHSRSSLTSLWRQYFQYGYWKVRVLQKHPRQMRPRQFVPPAFVAGLVLSALALPWSIGRWSFAAVVLLYGLANLVAVATSVRRLAGIAGVVYLPVAFAILHLSYGSGFLVGLVKFWNRWNDAGTRSVSARELGDLADGPERG